VIILLEYPRRFFTVESPGQDAFVGDLETPAPDQIEHGGRGEPRLCIEYPDPQEAYPVKVLALNSSPRDAAHSKTRLLLDRLVAGMRSAGAEVDVIHLREHDIRPCSGCFACWSFTPGRCVQDDAMTRDLMPKWLAADLVVYATPLYHFTMTATLKAFIERTLPAIEPFLVEEEGGRTGHPWRRPSPAAVVLSVAGFPEMEIFDGLSAYMRFLCRAGLGRSLVAEIYRPAAEAMMGGPFIAKRLDILAATEQAGREIVESGRVADETLARIRQPIADRAQLIAAGNAMWKKAIAKQLRVGG
jgi:multimeric flavodoxin WrbA